MKPNLVKREVHVSGVLASASFGFARGNEAHIAQLLRDNIYTDKPLAVLREYSSNGWDANRDAGRGDVPLTVVLPTDLESSLIIRDCGPGLCEEDIYTVYTQYGASTKRDTNDAVGMLGIGSKSGFAYNDSFTITSWYGGTKAVYHAVLDESRMGKVMKMWQGGLVEHVQGFVDATDPAELEGRTLPDEEWVDFYEMFEVTDLTDNDGWGRDQFVQEARTQWRAQLAMAGIPLLQVLPENYDPSAAPEGQDKGFRLLGDFVEPSEASHRLWVIDRLVDRFIAWMGEHHPDALTGVQVKVPVDPADVSLFHSRARNLFRYFRPMPDINIELTPPKSTWKTGNGWLTKSRHGYNDWTVVMGCVPYRLNIAQVLPQLKTASLDKLVEKMSGGLFCDIGDVSFGANREELEYTDATKSAIVQRMSVLVQDVQAEFDVLATPKMASGETPWTRRAKIRDFISTTGLPLPKLYELAWGGCMSKVRLYSVVTQAKFVDGQALIVPRDDTKTPKTFTLKKSSSTTTDSGRHSRKRILTEDPMVPMVDDIRILIRDTSKPWRGYVNEDKTDRVVVMKNGFSVGQVEKELAAFMARANLTGIKVLRMSAMDYVSPAEKAGWEPNPKHAQRQFQLTGTHNISKKSDLWTAATRHPDPDDVFVIINRFIPVNKIHRGDNFFTRVASDAQTLKHLFGEDMPTIWGLKTTQWKTIKEEDVEGVEYDAWFQKTFDECLSRHPEMQELMAAFEWLELDLGSTPWRTKDISEAKTRDWLREKLGWKNRVCQVFDYRRTAQKRINKLRVQLAEDGATKEYGDYLFESELKRLSSKLSTGKGKPQRWLEAVYNRYPLLRPIEGRSEDLGLCALRLKNHREHWLQYIQLVDTVTPRSNLRTTKTTKKGS